MANVNYPWLRVFPPEPEDFRPRDEQEGPRNMSRRDASPIEYFYLLFSLELMKEIVRQTNR